MFVRAIQRIAATIFEEDTILHLIIVNLAYDAKDATTAALLDHYFGLTGWAEGVRAADAKVEVWQRWRRPERLVDNGVEYHFTADAYGPQLRPWQLPRTLLQQVQQAAHTWAQQGEAVVVHLNGLVFPLAAWSLRRRLPESVPLIGQHHAERPYRTWRSQLQRWGQRGVDGFFFTNRVLAQEWVDRGIVGSLEKVYEIMEAPSRLLPQEKTAAQGQTGMGGSPILLWTGNLNANKDPLTILTGFRQLLVTHSEARLYMAFRYTDLLPEVEAMIQQDERLRESVILLGEIPQREIGVYYNSADIFVQGSAKESAGLALLDALACGVVPVVTDIPAFWTVTDDGRIGALWPVGDVAGFVSALERVLARPLIPQSQTTRALSEERWSREAIGRRASFLYHALWEQRNGR